MNKKQKARELLARLQRLKGESPAAKMAETLIKEVSKTVSGEFGRGPFPQALEKLAQEFEDFKGYADVDGIRQSLKDADELNTNSFIEFSSEMEDRLAEIVSKIEETDAKGDTKVKESSDNLTIILGETRKQFDDEKVAHETRSTALKTEITNLSTLIASLKEDYAPRAFVQDIGQVADEAKEATVELKVEVEKIKEDLKRRLSALNNGNGNMNRNIAIGGNVNALSKWTDINLKAGSNVTITYAANDATGYTDVTFSATGGSGSGIVRSVNTVAVNTLAGSTPTTDYVYLASGNITITLPTSVGNSNLYTIKNIGAGTVIVDTTGGETIDGGANVTMPVQFTSVDLISNNSGNWDVT